MTTTTPRDTMDQIGALEELVATLRAEILAEVREQLAGEIRTRRLVVVDDDGFERLVTEHGTDDDSGFALKVHTKHEHGTWVGLLATEPTEDDGPHQAELYLSAGGNGVGTLGTASGDKGVGAGRLWLEEFGPTCSRDQGSIQLTIDGLLAKRPRR